MLSPDPFLPFVGQSIASGRDSSMAAMRKQVARDHRPTIQDVAALAGLSPSTVSRALSGARPVGPDIAERVRQAADALSFRPNSVARSLRTQQTSTVGLVIPDIINPFFPLLVQAVEQATREHDLSVLFVDCGNEIERERIALDLLLDRRVDAIFISPCHLTASAPALRSASLRAQIVQIDRVIDDELPFATVDQGHGIQLLLEHLTETGRRHIAFIGSDPSASTSSLRADAFERFSVSHNPRQAPRVMTGDFSGASSLSITRSLLEQWPDTEAIVCANDVIAAGALQVARERLLDGQPGFAVTGFDNTMVAETGDLTSVQQPLSELANRAVDLFLGVAVSEPSPLIPTLVVRGSTATR
jgi:LacI family transcriptional regulator